MICLCSEERRKLASSTISHSFEWVFIVFLLEISQDYVDRKKRREQSLELINRERKRSVNPMLSLYMK